MMKGTLYILLNGGKMAKKTSGSLGFEKIVRPPYAQYLGVEMEVPGSWWPNTKGKEATKMFKVKVVDVQEQHVPTGSGPGAAGSVHMKVVLLSTSAHPILTSAEPRRLLKMANSVASG